MNKEDGNKSYEYLAFISYSHLDISWAKWLQESLEFYQLPTFIHSQHPKLPHHLRPIFRDETDMELGVLNDRIHNALSESKFLIVICSPNAAKSEYVKDEVDYFLKGHSHKYLIPFIVSGIPYANKEKDECLPSAILNLKEKPLAANINEFSKEYAMVKVVSYLLGGIAVRKLWDRYRIAKEQEEKRKEMERMNLLKVQSLYVSERIEDLISNGDNDMAKKLAFEILPKNIQNPERPYVPEAEKALRHALAKSSMILTKENKAVLDVTFGKDDTIVAAILLNGKIKLWDRKTGNLLYTIEIGRQSSHICFNSTGKYLIYDDGSNVIIYNIKTRTNRIINTGLPLINDIVPLSSSGEIMTVGSSICIWDIETGQLVRELLRDDVSYGWQSAVYCIKNDLLLAVSNDGRTITGYSLLSGTILWKNKTTYGFQPRIVYANEQDYVVLRDSSDISVINIFNGNTILRWKSGVEYYNSKALNISHNGHVVSVANDFNIILFDIYKALQSKKEEDISTEKYTGHFGEIPSLIFSKNDEYLLSCSRDGTIRIIDLIGDRGNVVFDKNSLVDFVYNDVYIFDNTSLLISEEKGFVGKYDLEKQIYERIIEGEYSIKKLSHNRRLLAYLENDNTIHLFDINNRHEILVFKITDTIERSVRIKLFNSYSDEDLKPPKRILSPRDFIYSPNDEYLLVIVKSNILLSPQMPSQFIIYRIANGEEIIRDTLDESLNVPAFSNDSSSLYITQQGSVKQIIIETGEVKKVCEINEDISCLLCPNDNLVLFASNQSITAFDVKNSNILYKTSPFGDEPRSIIPICEDYCIYCIVTGLRIFRTDSGETIQDIEMPEGISLFEAYYDYDKERILTVLLDMLSSTNIKDLKCFVKEWFFPSLSNIMKDIKAQYERHPLTNEERVKYHLL